MCVKMNNDGIYVPSVDPVKKIVETQLNAQDIKNQLSFSEMLNKINKKENEERKTDVNNVDSKISTEESHRNLVASMNVMMQMVKKEKSETKENFSRRKNCYEKGED